MENTTNLASPTARIEVVDALRGFAVLAILLVHNVEHFIYPVYPTSSPGWLEVMDLGVFHATFALFAGKSYSIFALLFGFTFFIQNENQRRRGKDFGYRFLWRMLLLMAFGTLNAAFYPAGDVLLLYALVGIILFLFRKASDRVLLVGALFFLLQPIEWYHFIASRIDVTHQLPDFGVAEMYAQTAAYTSEGDLWNFIWQNITLGQKASLLWAVNAGRYMQTAGLFLLGFYIGRKQLFLTTPSNQRLWIKILIIAAVVFSPLYALKEQGHALRRGDHSPIGRHGARYVAEARLYVRACRLVRDTLSMGRLPETDRRIACLWQDEPQQLCLAIVPRRAPLFPGRA